jgi:hypothetical protein
MIFYVDECRKQQPLRWYLLDKGVIYCSIRLVTHSDNRHPVPE